jgi:hypothetical protein
MALTRLLRAKQTIQFSRIGYTNSARSYSSSNDEIKKSTSSTKRGAAHEQREKAVESYVNKYMQENPGVFPKQSYVHKEVGGSWNTLKNILQNVKEKILGTNDAQLHEPNPNIDSKVAEGPDKTEVNGEKVTVSPTMKDNLCGDTSNDTVTKAIREKDYLDNLDRNPSIDSKAMDGSNGDKITVLPVGKDTLSGNTVNLTVTNAISEKDYPGNSKNDSNSINGSNEIKLDKEEIDIIKMSIMRIEQSVSTANLPASKSMTENGCLDNVDLSTSSVKPKDFVAESKIIAKVLREKVGQANIISDISKTTDFKSGEKARPFDSNLISKSDKLSSDKPEKVSFVKRLLQIGYANQEDKKMNNFSPVLSNIFGDVRKSQATAERNLFTENQDTSKTSQATVERNLFTENQDTSKTSQATVKHNIFPKNQDTSKTSQATVKHNIFTKNQDTSKTSQATAKHNIFTKNQDSFKTLQELVEMKLTSNGSINNQSSPSKGPSQKESLIQTDEELTPAIQTNEKVTPASPQEFSVSGEPKSSGLKGFIHRVKVLPIRQEGRIVKNSTQIEYKEGVDTKLGALNRPNSTRSPRKMTDMEIEDSLFGLNSAPVPLKMTDPENEERVDTNFNSLNRLNSTPVPLKLTDMENKEGIDTNYNTINRPNSTQVSLKINEKEPSQSQREGQNKVKLTCLPKTASKMHIYNAFRSSGDVESVEFIYDKGMNGSGLSAAVCFKTVAGLKKALELGHVIIHGQKVTVAELPTTTANTLPIPNLISTALSGLIKNPKRTIVIKQLTPDICYHHLEEAFSFCDSKITAVAFGSSKSVAYVEFKTEEGKNKALTKHSINVFGSQLLLTRIDAPRTTVVRLSNIANFHQIAQKLKPTCESFGRVAAFKIRHNSVLDIYFMLNEWPNMLNIVNSLNGMEIGPERLLAAPAPIYPPEILRALWNHPEEKRHVKAVVRGLIQKFGESSMNMVSLANTADKLYQD